jgi:thiol-disulfide isomerase/thioredoxin
MWLLLVALLFLPGTVHSEPHNPVQKLDLARLKKMVGGDGHFLLVFMAAWCAPCIKELPDLNALYTKYSANGLKMVGVSVDFDGPSAMQPIVDKLKIDFPIYAYGEKSVKKFKLNAIPMLFFIKEGVIVEKIYGRRPEGALNRTFKKFLK